MRAAPALAVLVGGVALTGLDGEARPGPDAHREDVGRLVLSEADVRFSDVRDLAVSDRGVWVLDGAEPFLTFVSRDGAAVIQFGSEGQGPSELLDPWGLQVEDADRTTVRVWDVGNARVAAFDLGGTLVDTRPIRGTGLAGIRTDIRQITYVDPFRVRRVGPHYIVASYPNGVSRTADFQTGALVRVDPALTPLAPVLAFSAEAVRLAPARTPLEFSSVPLWDGCSQLVVTWVPERGSVRWVDMTGAVRHEVSVEIERSPIKLDDIEAYLRRMARLELGPGWEEKIPDLRSMARVSRSRFALEAPAATEIRCATDDSAWLRMFSTTVSPVGLGSDWLRVETTGALTRTSFPEPFSPKAFTDEGAFGVWTDEVGLQQLARWTAAEAATPVTPRSPIEE